MPNINIMDFKTRLLEEKTQLDDKREKLQAFIGSDKFDQVAVVQQRLLNIQILAMNTYSQCLLERITALEEATA